MSWLAFADISRVDVPWSAYPGSAGQVRPRDILKKPSLFGRTSQPVEVAVPSDKSLRNLGLYAAAYQQHLFVVRLEEEIRSYGTNGATVARALDWQPGTLNRKLRGHDWMRPGDMEVLAAYFRDVSLLPALNATGDLLPPGLSWPTSPSAG